MVCIIYGILYSYIASDTDRNKSFQQFKAEVISNKLIEYSATSLVILSAPLLYWYQLSILFCCSAWSKSCYLLPLYSLIFRALYSGIFHINIYNLPNSIPLTILYLFCRILCMWTVLLLTTRYAVHVVSIVFTILGLRLGWSWMWPRYGAQSKGWLLLKLNAFDYLYEFVCLQMNLCYLQINW